MCIIKPRRGVISFLQGGQMKQRYKSRVRPIGLGNEVGNDWQKDDGKICCRQRHCSIVVSSLLWGEMD